MEWKNIYRGMAMGVSDIVHGVSGGTIAVILGIYDQFIASINGLFSKDWKRHLAFLIPLALGMGTAIVLFSHVMKWLLNHYDKVTFYFFIGLIVGILPYLFREVRVEKELEWYHFLLMLAGISAMCFIPKGQKDKSIITDLHFSTYVLLIISGILAIGAMILPGISV